MILVALVSQSASCPACCLLHSLVHWFKSNELFCAVCIAWDIGTAQKKVQGLKKSTNLLGESQGGEETWDLRREGTGAERM